MGSSWNIVIWLQHRLFGGRRSKTACSRLGIDLPCAGSTNRPDVSAKTAFNHHRNKETDAPNTHKARFSKDRGQFYIMTQLVTSEQVRLLITVTDSLI